MLDSPNEEAFDRLARLAAAALNAPTALVSLVNENRQFVKSCVGMELPPRPAAGAPLDYSFCQHVVALAEPLVVQDASLHPLVADNLAHLTQGVRSYLGVPLTTSGGHTIGSFCVLDVVPRVWTEKHLAIMADLAASVMTELELREQRRALERGHEFLTAVLENVIEGIVACDAEGRLTLFNRATRGFHGLPAEPIAKEEWSEHYDLYRADGVTHLPPAEVPLMRALNGEVVEHAEVVIAPKGRTARTILASGRALRRTDGTPLGAVIAMHDVTADRRITAERDRLVAILEGTSDFVGMTTPDGRVQYLNPAARRILGVAQDAALHQLDARAMHPESVLASLLANAVPAAVRHGVWSGESVLLAAGGREVPVWQVIIPHINEEGVPTFLSTVMRDMTAAKDAEQALRAAHAHAEQANRAKSELLSRASHELRTPLNAVIGFSGVLLKNRKGLLGDDEMAYVESILRNGKHLLGLVNDLLDLAKIEEGKIDLELARVSLIAVVHDVYETLAPRAAEFGLLLTVDVPGDATDESDFMIVTDGQRLRQILLNLAGNAVKYTPAGAVVIRLVRDGCGAPTRIDVIDTGPGISAERLPTIFEPFAVGGAVAQGDSATGLGLAITRSLCVLLGFRVTVESVLGEGATFSLHLAE